MNERRPRITRIGLARTGCFIVEEPERAQTSCPAVSRQMPANRSVSRPSVDARAHPARGGSARYRTRLARRRSTARRSARRPRSGSGRRASPPPSRQEVARVDRRRDHVVVGTPKCRSSADVDAERRLLAHLLQRLVRHPQQRLSGRPSRRASPAPTARRPRGSARVARRLERRRPRPGAPGCGRGGRSRRSSS